MTDEPRLMSIAEFAASVGRDRSSVHKALKKHGVRITVQRGPTGQRTSYARPDEMMSVYEGMSTPRPTEDLSVGGMFYFIRVMPVDAPYKINTGFTTDLERRLSEYRVSWHEAEVLHAWTARPWWERTFQDALEGVSGVSRVGEQFTIPDLDAATEHVTEIRSLLPRI